MIAPAFPVASPVPAVTIDMIADHVSSAHAGGRPARRMIR